MRHFRKFGCSIKKVVRAAAMSLPFQSGAMLLLPCAPVRLHAQSMLAGDISGTVLGPGGTATNRRSNAIR